MDKNLKEGLRWLDQAKADLKTANDLLEKEDYYASAFFSQQSAEKALKGVLYSKGFRAIVTHSVAELIGESSRYEEIFRGFMEQGRELDRHYIGSRYPNFYPSGAPHQYYTKEIAETCVKYAGLILREAEKFLKG